MTFEEWAQGLQFGIGVEDETATQVREVAKSAFEAGFKAGQRAAITHPDDASKRD
jgi:hypothetical protein